MEQNLPVASNKLWSFLRLMLFMIRKNISKTKLLLDLNMTVKRGKITKALQNLMLHHRPSASVFNPDLNEDEELFSCCNSPVYKNISQNKKSSAFNDNHDEIKALEMLTRAAVSRAGPGFGESPMVRELRVTDSPFPLCNKEDDSYVDEAAEKFILKFYNDLRRQS